MNKQQRWEFIESLDDELLQGGVVLSEWCSFIVRETDMAFVGNAHLATIVTAMAGIETHLRSMYPVHPRASLYQLIECAPIAEALKRDLHALRKYRNQWVHVSDPGDDHAILDRPEDYERELGTKAQEAVRALRQTVYENQWV